MEKKGGLNFLYTIREGMSAVLCRCTGRDGIVKAVAAVAAQADKPA